MLVLNACKNTVPCAKGAAAVKPGPTTYGMPMFTGPPENPMPDCATATGVNSDNATTSITKRTITTLMLNKPQYPE